MEFYADEAYAGVHQRFMHAVAELLGHCRIALRVYLRGNPVPWDYQFCLADRFEGAPWTMLVMELNAKKPERSLLIDYYSTKEHGPKLKLATYELQAIWDKMVGYYTDAKPGDMTLISLCPGAQISVILQDGTNYEVPPALLHVGEIAYDTYNLAIKGDRLACLSVHRKRVADLDKVPSPSTGVIYIVPEQAAAQLKQRRDIYGVKISADNITLKQIWYGDLISYYEGEQG